MTDKKQLLKKDLGVVPYSQVLDKMRDFTNTRIESTLDELWLVEHPPVFTQGQAGKAEHLLDAGDIPLLKTDRGGQITYHGPGQLVAYPLLNLKRLKLGVRDYVTVLENSVVTFLDYYGIDARPKRDAPGVYVEGRKVASLGLRVRKGCSFHGVAINLEMDLSPFSRINPCGYAGLEMTQVKDLVHADKAPLMDAAKKLYAKVLAKELNVQLC